MHKNSLSSKKRKKTVVRDSPAPTGIKKIDILRVKAHQYIQIHEQAYFLVHKTQYEM